MGQVLRITVNNHDHHFRVLRMAEEIEVEINGQQLVLVRHGRSWVSKGPADEATQALAEAIGKAITLRYRI